MYGAELGVRTYPTEGLDVYANYTLMDVVEDTNGCSAAQLASYVPDQRTSAHKVNAGVQIRTNFGIDASSTSTTSPPRTGRCRSRTSRRRRSSTSRSISTRTPLINGRIGYRFFRNKADIGVVANNLFNNVHKEYPFSEPVGQRIMGMFSYRF